MKNKKTSMDEKIDKLNVKLGNKTGIDFKGSAKAIGKEIFDNKPLFYGLCTAGGLFVLTSTGLILSGLAGGLAGFGFKKYKETKEEVA